jgi:hypothetical protein
MAIKEWCGKPCAECQSPCGLDKTIPCSPDCDNLKSDGTRNALACIAVGCNAVSEEGFRLPRGESLSFEVNNNGIMMLEQVKPDGEVKLTVQRPSQGVWNCDTDCSISAGDMVMLMNYYRYCKESGKEIMGEEDEVPASPVQMGSDAVIALTKIVKAFETHGFYVSVYRDNGNDCGLQFDSWTERSAVLLTVLDFGDQPEGDYRRDIMCAYAIQERIRAFADGFDVEAEAKEYRQDDSQYSIELTLDQSIEEFQAYKTRLLALADAIDAIVAAHSDLTEFDYADLGIPMGEIIKDAKNGLLIQPPTGSDAVSTLTEIIEVFETSDFAVTVYEEQGKECGIEIEGWTCGGVDMVHMLDFRCKPEGDYHGNVMCAYSIQEEMRDIADTFDVDNEIDVHREDVSYKADFTYSEAVADFQAWKERLQMVAEAIDSIVAAHSDLTEFDYADLGRSMNELIREPKRTR